MGQIKEHAFNFWIRRQNGLQQVTLSTSNVRNPAKFGEVIRLDDERNLTLRFGGHGLVKDATRIYIFLEVFPNTSGIHFGD